MSVDLRKLQVALLRIERRIVEESENAKHGKVLTVGAIIGCITGLSTIASQAADKLGSDAPINWSEKIVAVANSDHHSTAHALAAVYETLLTGHAVIEGMAVNAGARLLPMANGVPKRQIELVWTNLGLF